MVHFDLKNQFPVRNLINGDVSCVVSLLKLSTYEEKINKLNEKLRSAVLYVTIHLYTKILTLIWNSGAERISFSNYITITLSKIKMI